MLNNVPNSAVSLTPYLNVNNLINNEKRTIEIKIMVLKGINSSDWILKKFAMVLKYVESDDASGFDKIDKKGINVINDRSSVKPLIINKILKKINFFDLLGIRNRTISKKEK